MKLSARAGRGTSRRRFLGEAAAVAAAASVGRLVNTSRAAQVTTREDSPLPIIDTHQHLWDLSRFRLRWLTGNKQLGRSYLTADYLEATRGLNVVKAVYMEVDVDPAQQREEAEYVIGLCRSDDHPTVAAVISGRPASEEFASYIKAYRDSPYIKGVRQVLHAASAKAGLCLQDSFVRSIRLLGELGMRYDLCMRPAELADGNRLAGLCPETRFVLDHCGNASPQWFSKDAADSESQKRLREQWKRDLSEIAKRENVVCKISGIVASATPDHWTSDDLAPIVNHCLDEFGPDRVMFASDWPVCTRAATLAQWVHALQEIVAKRPRDEQRKLFHDNAQRFYELG